MSSKRLGAGIRGGEEVMKHWAWLVKVGQMRSFAMAATDAVMTPANSLLWEVQGITKTQE